MTHFFSNLFDTGRLPQHSLRVALAAVILFAALGGSAEAARGGGGGGHGGGGGRGGGHYGGGYGRGGGRGGGWGGGYYPGPALVCGNPYCAPPLIWTVFGAGGQCY